MSNGTIKLPMFFGSYYTVVGGPYRKRPPGYVGVKMAAEIASPCAVDIPVRDFCVPSVALATNGLRLTVGHILKGEPVYVGCMGGIGRTGLLLALLAKAWGIPDPVAYVRANYIPHAVETQEQKNFVADFVVPPDVLSSIFWCKWFNLFLWKTDLTKPAKP